MQSFWDGNHIRELICNHTEGALCSKSCTCVTESRYSETQFDKIVFVTNIRCSNSLLHWLLHALPQSDEIEFQFTGKSVERVTAEHYLSRVFNFLFMPQFEKMAISNLTSLNNCQCLKPDKSVEYRENCPDSIRVCFNKRAISS